MARVNHDADYREDDDSKLRLEIIQKVPCVCCVNNHASSWLPSSSLSCSRSIHSIWIPSTKSLFGFVVAFLLGAVVCSCWNDSYSEGNGLRLPWSMNTKSLISPFEDRINFSQESQLHHRTNFTCPNSGGSPICTPHTRERYVPVSETGSRPACPEYFRWIHEDLRPWKDAGITQEMVEAGREFAHFRLVVVDGRAYVQQYAKSFQTRDVFTLWGILQLLRLHGGRLPDLDLMFDCNDTPRIPAAGYRPLKEEASMPPPVFRYCGENGTVQIVFPDWSFWGWPEVNIKPWEALLEELKEGRRRRKWVDREPYAFWKRNPFVSTSRKDLLNCNASHGQDWNARIFTQDWGMESKEGFKQSNLANQCSYRYKIYIEGAAWSVSEKYILACDSPTLLVDPVYHDFFSRGILPLRHYWPINRHHKCSSIKFAVDWANNHTHKARLIGKEGSSFVDESLQMRYVYDYMFHVLTEYSKLLTYKPTVPAGAAEICVASMACKEEGLVRDFFVNSMVDPSSDSTAAPSCTLPPPMDPYEMEMLLKAKASSVEQVEAWERRAQTKIRKESN